MAEKDTEGLDESSLELPSLFGRKKKDKKSKRAAKVEAQAPEPTAPVDEPPAAPAEPVTTPAPAPAATTAAPAARESSATEETTVVEPVAEQVREPVAEPPTQQLPPVEPAPAARRTPEPETAPEATTPAEPKRKAKPKRSLPPVAASVAALVVGALVGLLGVGLTFGSLKACDAITGTDSCGGPGLLVVLVVVVVMIMAGSALLRALGVSEPGGLSFLGVAIFVAICLVFLLEQLLEPWMIVVGPVLCALGYGTAHWIVNRFNTELLAEDVPETHDVR